MDGRNCTGRTISLLNDSSDVASVPTKIQLPPLSAHSHSRSSSCSSTPSLTPQTPELVRSSSSDSRTFASPSPLTPALNSFDSAASNLTSKQQHYYHHHHQPQHKASLVSSPHDRSQAHQYHTQQYYLVRHPSSSMDDSNTSVYPPIPDVANGLASAYPMPSVPLNAAAQVQSDAQLQSQGAAQPSQPHQSAYRSSASPSSEPSRLSTVSTTSNSKPAPKKNQYPCPMAKQVGCNDFFTTSGHAARHAKKHTGKKDAFCPECNKAFTRKDNMEQHRRTHQNGRGASRIATDDKVKKPKQPTKKALSKPEPQFEAAVEQQLAEQAQQTASVQAPSLPLQAPQMVPPVALDQSLLLPAGGPYFLGSSLDAIPVPALPLSINEMGSLRPPLHRSSLAASLDYIPPMAPLLDADALHYSYPSPGLSNGLSSLALAASEHRRMSDEKNQEQSVARSPSQETPTEQSH